MTSSANGDYIFSSLPSGNYTVTFTLSGFQDQQKSVNVAPTQVVPLDATLGVATLAESVTVVGKTADVLTNTAQVATNFKQDMIANLRAEWSKLDRPDRIQELALRHLTLKPVEVRQFDPLDRLPERPADLVPLGTADPIGATPTPIAGPRRRRSSTARRRCIQPRAWRIT